MANCMLLKMLGQGSYGVVFLARPKSGPNLDYFVLKLTPRQHSSLLLKEQQILEQFIGCPEIVQCLGSEDVTLEEGGGDSLNTAFYSLKLEYAAGGTLADLIKQRKKLPENDVKDYLKMILRGLSSIHRKGFVHVDLKPANILAFPQSDGTMKLKITDFGLSKRCGAMDGEDDGEDYRGIASFRGTPKYMSPESIIFSEVNCALDIWSLGCVLVKMVSGKSVWGDCRSRQQLMSKLLDEMEVPKIPKELSEQGKDFIGKCFVRHHKLRWTADMLLQHPYLSEENEANLLPHQLYDKPKTQSSDDNWKSIFPKEHYLPHQLCNIKSNI